MTGPTPSPASTPAHAPVDAPGGGSSKGYLASTVKHGLVYFLGNVLGRIAGFIMLPVYTRLLTAADYGILEILALSTDVLGMLAGLGIQQAVIRFYYQYTSDEDRGAVVSTAAIIMWTMYGVIAIAGLTFSTRIAEVLLGPGDLAHFVQLAVVAFAVGAIGDVPGVYFQAKQDSRTSVTASFVRLVLALSLNILFVVVLRMGVAGIFLSTIISSVVVGGFMAVWVLRRTGVRFVPRIARELVGFGSPLIFSQIGSFALHFSDRYFLRHFQTLAVVGLYSLSYKFAMLLAMFVTGPFHTIWNPKALEIDVREGPRAPEILRSILQQYNLVLVTTALGIALFATDVIHIVLGQDFHAADRAVPLLTLGIVFFCYRPISQTGAMIAKRPGYIGAITSFAAVLALVMNLLFIPRWGAMGAAASTAISFGIEFLMMLAMSERVYRIGITVRELFAPLLVAAAVWAATVLVVPADASPVTGLAVRIAAVGVYALVLSATGILTPAAWRMLLRSARDPRAMLKALRSA